MADDKSNVDVETPPVIPPNPNPPPKVETPPANPAFNDAEFFTALDTKMSAWTEKAVSAVKEAFPAPTPPAPPKEEPPKSDPPKSDPPKEEAPKPGKKTFREWWGGNY